MCVAEPGSADPLVLSPTSTLTRFAEIVAADLAAKEKKFGFPLDQEDKDTFELMLRNKYCGPQGLSSGWGLPGGPCEPSNGCETLTRGGLGAGCEDRKKKKFQK